MKQYLIVCVTLFSFCFCGSDTSDNTETHSTKKNKLFSKKNLLIRKYKEIRFKPIFFERLTVCGKFYDKNKIDTLKESYISLLTMKETCNDYKILNYKQSSNANNFDEVSFINDTLMSLICNAEPQLKLKSKNTQLKPLVLNHPDVCNVIGIDYLINVGDINSDGKDEIAVLCGYFRFMGLTSICNIYSYKNNQWESVLSFTVYGPIYEDEIELKKVDKTKEIPGFLEKKKGIWFYHDYQWEMDGYDSPEDVGKIKMKELKV